MAQNSPLATILTHSVSRVTRFLTRLDWPRWAVRFAIERYIDAYGITMEDAAVPPNGYACVDEFFTRDFRPESRPVGERLVSPVDGKIVSAGRTSAAADISIKGNLCSLATLFGGEDLANQFYGGSFACFYLSPSDFHHVHAPTAGRLIRVRWIPGALWPVNSWGIRKIPGLFGLNERVVLLMESENGPVALVMVGALNVGSISLKCAESPYGSFPWDRALQDRGLQPSIAIARGERLGTFHLGSSVLLVVPASNPHTATIASLELDSIKMGASLIAAHAPE